METTQECDSSNELSNEYISYLKHLTSSWNSHIASRLINKDLIHYIESRFYRCSTTLKVRILMSLLYISPQLIEECKIPLSHLLNDCETDADDWVRKLSRLLQPYVATGHIDIREVDTEVAYRCMKYLDEKEDSGKPYRFKPSLEYSRVFDVTEEVWPPPLSSNNQSSDSPNLYPTLFSYLNSLPSPSPDTHNFTPHGDYNLFMHDIQNQGVSAIWKELKNIDNQQNRRRDRNNE